MVANPSAITFDRDLCFEWFENCLTDLENETQREFFQKMLDDGMGTQDELAKQGAVAPAGLSDHVQRGEGASGSGFIF